MATPPTPLTPLLALISGYVGGSLTSEWDSTLSFKMNMVGKIVDAFGFFPSKPPPKMINNSTSPIINPSKPKKHEPTSTDKQLIIFHRKNWDLAGWIATRNLPPIGTVIDTSMNTRDHDMIRLRIYSPDKEIQSILSSSPEQQQHHHHHNKKSDNSTTIRLKPVFVYVHGGGFCFGSGFDIYEGVCRKIAMGADVVVVAVEYRVAPEFKYPIPLNDCVDAIRWIYSEPEILKQVGGAPQKRGIAIGGDSAGGNLTASAAVICKMEIPLRLQVLIYPCTSAYSRPKNGIIQSSSSLAIHARAYILPAASLAWIWDMYLQHPEQDALDPYASPVLFSLNELKACAPALLLTADHDVLQDECLEYGQLLESAGINVTHKHFTNTFHGFINSDFADGHHDAIKLICDTLKHNFMMKTGGRL
jgi:acetyl esterase